MRTSILASAVALITSAYAAPVLTESGEANYTGNGNLTVAVAAPYVPSGGLGTNNSVPKYAPASDFDYQSLALGLYQEYIELDLFHHGLAMFSDEEFEASGITAADRFLLEFMADQEVGHATLISHMLGPTAPVQCTYQYPFTTVPEFIDFCQKLTRFGESGVYGFLAHMNSGAAATMLLQSITTEARQQMIFRQFEGLFPMPVWFETGIPQSWQWTLLAPYIASCPANMTHQLVWQNFPTLNILNNPNASNPVYGANISTNRTTVLSTNQTVVQFQWDAPGMAVGPDNAYTTHTSSNGTASQVAWVSQLNTTYTPLTLTGNNTGYTTQPGGFVFSDDGVVNGTMFVAIVDQFAPYVTPYNLSMINTAVIAGPALYQSG